VILIATRGAALSAAAAALPRLQPPPYGPRAWPFIGNALCFTGPYEVPMYNIWHHVFLPGTWGDTVRLVLRAGGVDPTAGGAFGTPAAAGGVDDMVAREETIFTSDPEVGWGGGWLVCVSGVGGCQGREWEEVGRSQATSGGVQAEQDRAPRLAAGRARARGSRLCAPTRWPAGGGGAARTPGRLPQGARHEGRLQPPA
jgi:hypothetical protein